MIRTRVPAIPAPTDANLVSVARAVKGILDVREGHTGDPLDTTVTFRDLVDGGLATVALPSGGSGSQVSLIPPTTSDYDPTTDLSVPPKPTGFTATGMFGAVQLQWDAPSKAYRNPTYAEIWRAETDVIGSAQLIGTTETRFYVDYLAANTTRYYWVRFMSAANIAGPYNATAGTKGQTAQNSSLLLASLTNQITETQLYSTLGARISLIDGPATAIGTVNNRIAAEASERSTADGKLFAQYTVKIDQSGYVTGYGLASTNTTGTPTSTFAVRADSFYIANPSGPGVPPATPFIVRTTATTIGGEYVPVGVYMSNAFIQNGTITTAKISSAAITDAKIANLDAAKITSGYISGDRIQAGTLDAKIANIDAAKITSGVIDRARIGNLDASQITTGQMDAARINVTQLSGLSANLGTVTAGQMRSADGKFIIDLNYKFIYIEV